MVLHPRGAVKRKPEIVPLARVPLHFRYSYVSLTMFIQLPVPVFTWQSTLERSQEENRDSTEFSPSPARRNGPLNENRSFLSATFTRPPTVRKNLLQTVLAVSSRNHRGGFLLSFLSPFSSPLSIIRPCIRL